MGDRQLIQIWPYKKGSRSAKVLAKAVGGRVVRRDKPNIYEGPVVNWGDADPPGFVTLNKETRVASNKLHFFRRINDSGLGDDVPPFWERAEDIPDGAFPVVCRTVLAGHSGAGIVISSDRNSLVPARLYVQYVKKEDEYRVHCTQRGIFLVQRKARRLGTDSSTIDWRVRNHDGGFVFCRNGVCCPDTVRAAANRILKASGLDFGAVDVIWNAKREKAYVLEINTAPGLEGSTVEDYAAMLRELVG